MFRKSIAQQMLALKIGQPSLTPALHSSAAAASSASASAAAAASPSPDQRGGIESTGGLIRGSQWEGAPPSTLAQKRIGEYWGKRIGAHIKFHTKREKQELAARQVRDRDEVFLDPQPSTANEGDLRLNKLQWWLNNLGVQRSPDQVSNIAARPIHTRPHAHVLMALCVLAFDSVSSTSTSLKLASRRCTVHPGTSPRFA
jgi:hypothetical protein